MAQKARKTTAFPTTALFDSKYQKTQLISGDDLEKKFRDLSQTIISHLSSLETIGKYELDTVTLTIALRAGVLVVSAEGGVSLTYKIPPGTEKGSS